MRIAAGVALVLQALCATVQADGDTPPDGQAVCDTAGACPELDTSAANPSVEVAGVQTSADDAQQPGEGEPFIINDGFGD